MRKKVWISLDTDKVFSTERQAFKSGESFVEGFRCQVCKCVSSTDCGCDRAVFEGLSLADKLVLADHFKGRKYNFIVHACQSHNKNVLDLFNVRQENAHLMAQILDLKGALKLVLECPEMFGDEISIEGIEAIQKAQSALKNK